MWACGWVESAKSCIRFHCVKGGPCGGYPGDPSSALDEIDRLTKERDQWRARAFAMFWKLPGNLTIGQLQDDAERAAVMFGLNEQQAQRHE